MNKEILKFMDLHKLNDGLLREFLFKGKKTAAKEQAEKLTNIYSKKRQDSFSLFNMIDKDMEEV